MNPDSNSEGRKKKNAICIACSWFLAMVEKVMPTARLAAMKKTSAASNSGTLPTIGTSNRNCAASRIKNDLDVSDQNVGNDLADHHLDRAASAWKAGFPWCRARVRA